MKTSFNRIYTSDSLELKGKTVGIVGLGTIGSAIAERAKGLGMDVVYWSKSSKDNEYKPVELTELFETADVIFPTMAINEETKKVITPELLASMKSSALFVSVVHDLFDERTVLDMVKDGKLFGFGFEAEPNSFKKYEGNVWAAPAYTWTTDGSMNNSMVKWVENMVSASKGACPNMVN